MSSKSRVVVDLEKTESVQSQSEAPLALRTPSVRSMDSDFPEGGLTGWLVVFGSFCAMISVFGLINTAAVFESWFSTHQLAQYSSSQIGWIFSLYLFFVFFIGIQVGPVFDAYGPRYLVATGSVLMVASLLLLGFCTEYYQILLCYSFLGGLGGALLNSPSYGCIAHFFNARRGLATGIATTSGGVGGIIFPLILKSLLPKLGFAWSTRILGLILLAFAVPANLWIRARLLPKGKLHSVLPDVTIFRDRRYLAAAVGIFFMEWGIFVPLTFIVSYAATHQQDATESYILLSLLNAGSVVGRFLPGLISDRLGRFNTIIATIALSAVCVFGLWLPAGDSPGLLIGFAVAFGFASGSNLSLSAVCLGQLCEAQDFGRYISKAMIIASFGTLTSVPIGGALLNLGGGGSGWAAMIVFSGTSYVLALVCYTTARVLAVGWRWDVIF
ncbi:MFS general substrate transporter [Coniochaeta ligniaria NRRL 30616]|uniref:MFS general substrate transporter n=1 Tax=Coniochaeta ligniaria NRRL 30616 TaxID=1408157 RepID=A0A1J7IXB3_9PEZI|nr:MFS general substrate transporter [Coniochaeta ligniaria NRRL 30616]